MLFDPSTLPPYCEPQTQFLYKLSSTSGTCIPTNEAFVTTLLGTLSIIAWLFAQLPQIYKNYALRSTSGLSIFFLGEWLLGDISNLLGCILTEQATWQIIIGIYYCFVDCMLTGQWLWCEKLQHGRTFKNVWLRRSRGDDRFPGNGGLGQAIDGMSVASSDTARSTAARSIPRKHEFHTPNFASSPMSTKEQASSPSGNTPTGQTIYRVAPSSSPMPSPRTILFISLVLALAVQASPIHGEAGVSSSGRSTPAVAGAILSWLSTALYLLSRLPQLIKNHLRRSTSGLSFTLFLAAFFGNLFYSTSILTAPQFWHSYPSHGLYGWIGPEGSNAVEHRAKAMPFFLGAAGVLVMDAAVAMQFWYFGTSIGKDEDKTVVRVVVDGDDMSAKRWRWRRVSGWMRGWIPSVSLAATPAGTPCPDGTPTLVAGSEDERRRLLNVEGGGGAAYGGV